MIEPKLSEIRERAATIGTQYLSQADVDRVALLALLDEARKTIDNAVWVLNASWNKETLTDLRIYLKRQKAKLD